MTSEAKRQGEQEKEKDAILHLPFHHYQQNVGKQKGKKLSLWRGG